MEKTAPGEVRVARALLSVSDKSGLVEFARGLSELGVEIVSTGGTAAELSKSDIPVRSITDFTGFPEIMDGRVKTLHPKLYGGLLALRDNDEHLAAAQEQDVEFVDLVCVNLYPFAETIARDDVTDAEAIENIDIGGPTMVRATAKNFPFAAIVVNPDRYESVLDELKDSEGKLSLATRESLAAEAFAHTAAYDATISNWFANKDLPGEELPSTVNRNLSKALDLSYGENPHQRAAFYVDKSAEVNLLSGVEQLNGKALSFNNLLDLHSARGLCREFSDPACVIVKHNNPCGCAVAAGPLEAYLKAFACDPTSAFGGVIVFNREVDGALAQELTKQFIEVLFAPSFTDEALDILKQKQNLRILLDTEQGVPDEKELDVRYVTGGLLIQDRDHVDTAGTEWTQATTKTPTDQELADLKFAWTVCAHVKSNAIIFTRDGATLGIGAGQMSRVDSVRLAVEKFQGESLAGAVLASDAFFPFADGPELAIEAGITAIAQPGGSIRDEEVVAAADAAGVSMLLTGRRHFRH